MKSILAASPAFLLAGALLAAPAGAQTMAQPTPYQPAMNQPAMQQPAANQPAMQQPAAQPYGAAGMTQRQTSSNTLPRGSYLRSCKDARMLEGTLTAFCSQGNGTWQTVQLGRADQCTGDIRDVAGRVTGVAGPEVGSTTPPESYGSSYGSASGGTQPAPSATYGSNYASPSGAYAGNQPTQNQYTSTSAGKTARPPY